MKFRRMCLTFVRFDLKLKHRVDQFFILCFNCEEVRVIKAGCGRVLLKSFLLKTKTSSHSLKNLFF